MGIIPLASALGFAQTPAATPIPPSMSQEVQAFPLWPGSAPGASGHEESDIPTLTYYPATHPVGTAVIVAPGGGYRILE